VTTPEHELRPAQKVSLFGEVTVRHSYAVSLAVENAADRGVSEPDDYWSPAADAYWSGILTDAESIVDSGELDR
jgi:hypothetical protein